MRFLPLCDDPLELWMTRNPCVVRAAIRDAAYEVLDTTGRMPTEHIVHPVEYRVVYKVLEDTLGIPIVHATSGLTLNFDGIAMRQFDPSYVETGPFAHLDGQSLARVTTVRSDGKLLLALQSGRLMWWALEIHRRFLLYRAMYAKENS